MKRNPLLYLLISTLGITWMFCGTISWMYYAAANNYRLTNVVAGTAFFLVSGLALTVWFLSKGNKTMGIFNKKSISTASEADHLLKRPAKQTALNQRSKNVRVPQSNVHATHRERAKAGDVQVGGEWYTAAEYDWYFGPDDDDL